MIQSDVDLTKITWPDNCAYCNEAADSAVRARSQAVQSAGFWGMAITYSSRVIEFAFPVCRAHKAKAVIASFASQRRLLSLGLGVLTAFALLGAAGDFYRAISHPDPYEFSWAKIGFLYAFPLLYWGTFFWARKNAPILIHDIEGRIVLRFRNDEFGRAFSELNGNRHTLR